MSFDDALDLELSPRAGGVVHLEDRLELYRADDLVPLWAVNHFGHLPRAELEGDHIPARKRIACKIEREKERRRKLDAWGKYPHLTEIQHVLEVIRRITSRIQRTTLGMGYILGKGALPYFEVQVLGFVLTYTRHFSLNTTESEQSDIP